VFTRAMTRSEQFAKKLKKAASDQQGEKKMGKRDLSGEEKRLPLTND